MATNFSGRQEKINVFWRTRERFVRFSTITISLIKNMGRNIYVRACMGGDRQQTLTKTICRQLAG